VSKNYYFIPRGCGKGADSERDPSNPERYTRPGNKAEDYRTIMSNPDNEVFVSRPLTLAVGAFQTIKSTVGRRILNFVSRLGEKDNPGRGGRTRTSKATTELQNRDQKSSNRNWNL